VKTEYVYVRPPESRLKLHTLPPLRASDGTYSNDSLVKAYKASIKELKLCNVDKEALR
jgi:hypothetical protein